MRRRSIFRPPILRQFRLAPDSATNALPDLVENMEDPDVKVRDAAWRALFDIAFDQAEGRFRPECSQAMVPHLIRVLADPKADALRIVRMLSDIGREAEPALPAVEPFLKNRDRDIRMAADRARERITTGMYRQP